VAIKLTKPQEKWARWAIDAMDSLSEEGRVEIWGEGQVREISPDVVKEEQLDLANWSEGMVEDLLYRLEVQACDVAETDADTALQIARRCAPALNVAEKIREALKIGGEP